MTMKRRKKQIAIVIILIVVIYLALMIVGLMFLSIFPINDDRTAMMERSELFASDYAEGNMASINDFANTRNHAFVYDMNGECVIFASGDEEKSFEDFRPFTDPMYNSTIAADKGIYSLSRSYFSKSLTHVWTSSTAFIYKDGEKAGVIIIIHSLTTLQETYYGYIIYFTAFYAIVIALLYSTKRKQRKLDQLKNNYIANVTHSLKTPIASIKVLAETLSEHDESALSPEKRQEYYGLIIKETNIQAQMVHDMLELSKIQSQSEDFSKSTVQIKPVLDGLTERYSAICEYSDITFSITENVYNLPLLYTNEDALLKVLEILVDNALKYVPEDGKVIIDASVSGKQATVKVWDNGNEIAPEDLEHLFERFYQGKNNPDGTGSGLGLAIVKEILDALGSSIRVRSEGGKGTTFYFTVALK